MRIIKSAFLATTILSAGVTSASAEVNVMASIKPIHSLVSAVMDGAGTPSLIIEGAGSPHNYALKPSQAAALQDADLVFWVGHDLEAFLEKAIDSVALNARSIALSDAHGLTKIKFREGGSFDAHAHDEHDDHDDHDEHDDHHDHDKHDDHDDHDKHDDHDDHGHEGYDPHVWLDPENAKALIHEIEEALVAADPENAATYERNAEAMMRKLDALITEINAELEPVKGKGYVVFHDAYQYFERRFGVSAVGSITVSPEILPGAKRVSELQEKVKSLDATCVFSEPQFEPKLVTTITENTTARTGVLDPLGASIESGPGLYFTLIRTMAHSLKDCLLGKS